MKYLNEIAIGIAVNTEDIPLLIYVIYRLDINYEGRENDTYFFKHRMVQSTRGTNLSYSLMCISLEKDVGGDDYIIKKVIDDLLKNTKFNSEEEMKDITSLINKDYVEEFDIDDESDRKSVNNLLESKANTKFLLKFIFKTYGDIGLFSTVTNIDRYFK